MILKYPAMDMEIVSSITLNFTQMMQLRDEITAAQNLALSYGLIIGGAMGAIGVIAAWCYLSSKRFA
jgi:hypothetical protein